MPNKLKIVYKKISEIIPYEKNPRKNDETVKYVANMISEVGFINPIVVNEAGIILAGHTRLKAAKKLGLKEVPVIYVDELTEEQQKAYRLGDNKTAEFSEWDEDLLGEELASILNIDMSLFGFDGESEIIDVIEDDTYTMAVNVPQYEITGICPTFDKMIDETKSQELIDEILKSNVNEEEKHFLIEAAKRHNVFNYRNIAEYYAHASEEMQNLMEKSALVIIDINDAIAYGYAALEADIANIMEDDDA